MPNSDDKIKPPAAPHLNPPADEETWSSVPLVPPEMPALNAEGEDMLSLYARPQAASAAEYEDVLLRHIRLRYQIQFVGSPLIDLNRRFSHLSKRYGVSVRDMVRKLRNANLVEYHKFRGHMIILPKDAYLDLISDPVRADTLMEACCAGSLRDIGIEVPEVVSKRGSVTKGSTFF